MHQNVFFNVTNTMQTESYFVHFSYKRRFPPSFCCNSQFILHVMRLSNFLFLSILFLSLFIFALSYQDYDTFPFLLRFILILYVFHLSRASCTISYFWNTHRELSVAEMLKFCLVTSKKICLNVFMCILILLFYIFLFYCCKDRILLYDTKHSL